MSNTNGRDSFSPSVCPSSTSILCYREQDADGLKLSLPVGFSVMESRLDDSMRTCIESHEYDEMRTNQAGKRE